MSDDIKVGDIFDNHIYTLEVLEVMEDGRYLVGSPVEELWPVSGKYLKGLDRVGYII